MKKNYESGKDTSPIPKKLLLVMKLTAFLIILFTVQVTATVYSQNKKLTIDVQGSSIKEVLQKIEAQSEYRFIYENEKVNLDTKVSLRVKDEVVEKILKQLFDKDGISFSITENNLILINPTEKRMNGLGRETSEQQPQKTVSGKVAEQSGVPIPGATVLVKGTNNGTITDINGSYTLSNVPANATLVFSFVGMKSQDVLLAGKSTIDVVLREDAIGIEEVVAIGYGTAKKKDLTGAVGRVDIEESRMAPNTNASQILRGTTAGVQVTDNGRPGSSGSIVIRGRNSISGSNDPLIVLDGIIYAGGSLSDINPGDIESIDILKDASSAAIYGSLAANGVIEITTKRGKEGKPKITFNSYIGSSDFAHIPDYLNAEQYLAARKDYEAAVGGSVPFQPTETANIEAERTINPF